MVETIEGLQNRLLVIGVKAIAILAILDQFTGATILDRTADGFSTGHGLWYHQAPVVLKRRHKEYIAKGVVLVHLIIADATQDVYAGRIAILGSELVTQMPLAYHDEIVIWVSGEVGSPYL